MLILLKIIVCLVNTGTWGNQDIEYLCCKLIENVSSISSSAIDLLLDLRQVISPFSAIFQCFFFLILLPHLGYAEYSSEQFFLVWVTEQCEALVMATVLKMVPDSLKSELLWGWFQASIRLGTEGCSLGKALPRGFSIPNWSLHHKDRGDACEWMIVTQGISSLPVAREHKATWRAQTIDISTNILIKMLLQNKSLVVSNDYRFHHTNAPQPESNCLHCPKGSMYEDQPALRNYHRIPGWELCSSPQLQWRHRKWSTGLHTRSV